MKDIDNYEMLRKARKEASQPSSSTYTKQSVF